MPTLDITDDHRDRIETLREELAAAHAGEYASVGTADTLHYLLDLAEAVEDPGRDADPEALGGGAESDGDADRDASSTPPFDREVVRERLEARNRKHGDPDDESEMDLYGIAAAFDVAGRSEMTKAELVEAILDEAERLAADPFARVDVDVGGGGPGAEESGDEESDGEVDEGEPEEVSEPEEASEPEETTESDDDESGAADPTPSATSDAGSSQLNAMMSLLDTHDDKWHEGDGDARYEVELPDGDVETARTKDDVRALLFKNY